MAKIRISPASCRGRSRFWNDGSPVAGVDDFKTVGRGQDPAAAVVIADAIVHRHYTDAVRLLSRDAGWRTRDATDKQLELLRKRGLPAPPQLSRGQASWMLSYVLGGR